ncbi:MAG: UTP--glucose-1-phosphate uridylyltransferase GalU [Actinomycetota bacterium]
MSAPIRTAVIPAAGLGTRFLPATKAMPKEMLPLVDKPLIQYVVEEAVRAGITDVCVVTSRNKAAIEDHFDRSIELEQALETSGKQELLGLVRDIAELAELWTVRQGTPRGLGHAVGCARGHVGDHGFAVLLPDDIMHPSSNALARMIEVHEEHDGAAVIAFMEVSAEEIALYGCADATPLAGDVVRLDGIVEKPAPEEAPSNLAVMGRYVFPADIFAAIDATPPGKGGEIQLTDAIAQLCAEGRAYGVVVDGGRFDAGNKDDYLRATVELALEHPELGPTFAETLRRIVADRGLV